MLTEGLGLNVEKIAEIIISASDVAELGAVKPVGFGSLIRRRLFSETAHCETNELHASVFPKFNLRFNLFGEQEVEENPYLSLKYNEVSMECSEYLCDYDITPKSWENATPEQRMDMQKKALDIMSKEFSLPEEWANSIKIVPVHTGENKALAVYKVKLLSGGGIDVSEIPTIEVDMAHYTDDYFEAMCNIYHEMIHIKQLASVNRVAPTSATDLRLLDLIKYYGAEDPDNTLKINNLSFPPEAEARVQTLCFEQMLHTSIRERNL